MTAHVLRTSWRIGSIVALFVICTVVVGTGSAAEAAVAAAPGGSWTVYHGDAEGSGVAASVTTIDSAARAWTSPTLDGKLYGEPLVFKDDVYVATENDTLYALSSATGAVAWSTHIATPVSATSLPCGDIAPTVGITGTPVIDPTRNEIFVVADESVNGTPQHVLVGLNATSGAIELRQNVDPPGSNPAALLQRTGLALDAGQVVFGMGGNFGDCSTYRGRVVAVNETGGTPNYFTVDAAADQDQGAIWMGGAAPAVDANGNIWVSAGNGSVESDNDPYDNSDSALELNSSLQLLQYFAPTSWAQDNADDLDMSITPALLSDGQVVLAGKSRVVYLLNGAHLGGIGGQEASIDAACSSDIDGGSAVVGTTVYLPCVSGPVAVQVAAPSGLGVLWKADVGGGPPILAAGLVWTIGQNGTLYGLDPATGSVRQQASIGTPANHFPTPSVGDGLLLATSATDVVAFTAAAPSSSTTTSAPPQTTAPSSTTPTTHRQGQSTHGSNGGLPVGAVIGIAVGGLVALGAAFWLARRRQRHNRSRVTDG